MPDAAKKKSLSPARLAALRVLLVLVVALCLGQTRVWGFGITGQHASGKIASVSASAVGEIALAIAYDASGSPVAAKTGAPALYDARFGAQQMLENGQVSLNRLKSFVPEGTPNTFKPSSTIEFGQKYQFQINGSKIEVKFHSPDAVAAARFPGSTSGSHWTSQIKIDGKLLGADGQFYTKPGNVTHIPIVELP